MKMDYKELLLIRCCTYHLPPPFDGEVGGFILTDCVFDSFIDDYAGNHSMLRTISKGLK